MMNNLNKFLRRNFLRRIFHLNNRSNNYSSLYPTALFKSFPGKSFCDSNKLNNSDNQNKDHHQIEAKSNTASEEQATSHNTSHNESSSTHVDYSNIKGVKTGDSSHYIIQFTCKKCEYRTTRMFTKKSYHYGIVLIRCEGCEGVHLIADNLGWFEDTNVNIEDIIKRKGEEYRKLNMEGLFNMSTKDVLEELKENKH